MVRCSNGRQGISNIVLTNQLPLDSTTLDAFLEDIENTTGGFFIVRAPICTGADSLRWCPATLRQQRLENVVLMRN